MSPMRSCTRTARRYTIHVNPVYRTEEEEGKEGKGEEEEGMGQGVSNRIAQSD
jgi:hypothetical protein